MDTKDFKIFCINLTKRPDRWEQSIKEFYKLHIDDVFRFAGIEDKDPLIGCGASHFSILKMWQNMGKHLIIFEDDVQFINNYKDIELYIKDALSIGFDMLYFGANITTPIERVTDRLGILTHAQSTHAYCVHKDFIKHILSFEHMLGKPMDLIYAENIIPYNKCYITIPMLAIQRPSYSDIEKKNVNYEWMEDRYNANLRKG